MKLERVKCVINRAAALQIEKTVPSWELPVLHAIFGAPNVHVVSSETYEGQVDAREEWASLSRRYATATDEDANKILAKVYPSAEVLENAIERATRRKQENRVN